MTSGNGHPAHTPLCIPSSHCQMRSHYPQGNTSWAHTWPHGAIFINRRHSPTEKSLPWGKKTKDSGVDRWTSSMNLLSLFWPSLACLTGLSDMCNDHLEPASLGAHSPLVVYLHLTTATHSASCYTKHKNKQIIQQIKCQAHLALPAPFGEKKSDEVCMHIITIIRRL